jgi:hypothetical protein
MKLPRPVRGGDLPSWVLNKLEWLMDPAFFLISVQVLIGCKRAEVSTGMLDTRTEYWGVMGPKELYDPVLGNPIQQHTTHSITGHGRTSFPHTPYLPIKKPNMR